MRDFSRIAVILRSAVRPKRSSFLLFLLLFSGWTQTAFAEVCDKYDESWRPGDPPLNSLSQWYTNPIVLLLLSSFILASFFRVRRWLQVNLVLFSIPVLLEILGDEQSNEVFAAAVKEGCMEAANDWMIVIPASLAVISAFLIWFSPNKNRNKPDKSM